MELVTKEVMGPLTKILLDGLAILASYLINFIFCDLMYHNFNIKQSMRGSYWFILGPTLYIFGPSLRWLQLWIKSIIGKERMKIKEKLEEWLKNINPFGLLNFTTDIMDKTLFSEKAIEMQKDNMNYLIEIKRIV